MSVLSPRQAEVLAFIRAFVDAHGFAPTRKDICAEFGWTSTYAATCIMYALRKKGFIAIDSMKSRGVRLLGDAPGEVRMWNGYRGLSRSGQRFVFIEPTRDRETGAVYFGPTPIVARVS